MSQIQQSSKSSRKIRKSTHNSNINQSADHSKSASAARLENENGTMSQSAENSITKHSLSPAASTATTSTVPKGSKKKKAKKNALNNTPCSPSSPSCSPSSSSSSSSPSSSFSSFSSSSSSASSLPSYSSSLSSSSASAFSSSPSVASTATRALTDTSKKRKLSQQNASSCAVSSHSTSQMKHQNTQDNNDDDDDDDDEKGQNNQSSITDTHVAESNENRSVGDKFTKKQRKSKLNTVNQKIQEYAQNKQLGLALEEFATLQEKKISPSIHTYTNMINACVRCGEVSLALKYFKEIRVSKLTPNEVTYTVLLKGLVNDNRMGEARWILQKMKESGNSNSSGNRNSSSSNVCKPNIRTYDTILRGCMRHGDLLMAKMCFSSMCKEGEKPSMFSYEYMMKIMCMNLSIDSAWLLAAEMQEKDMLTSSSLLHLAKACALVGERENCEKALRILDVHNKKSQVKRTFQFQLKQKDKHERSLVRFQQMREREDQKEEQDIREYLSILSSSSATAAAPTTFHPGVCLPLVKSFPPVPDSSLSSSTKQQPVSASHTILDFKEIFGNTKSVCLEIGSGGGEWVVRRAQEDKDLNWVGLEIRFERIYEIWGRSVFAGTDNLLVLHGDARKIFQHSLITGSVGEVFVNFPEPPVWEHSSYRLLTVELFNDIHLILKAKGQLTILTDNEPLCQSVLREMTLLLDVKFKSNLPDSPTGFSSKIPDSYGTSYFDRLWTNGERKKRYFLQFLKL